MPSIMTVSRVSRLRSFQRFSFVFVILHNMLYRLLFMVYLSITGVDPFSVKVACGTKRDSGLPIVAICLTISLYILWQQFHFVFDTK
jgi:hypothetical protein